MIRCLRQQRLVAVTVALPLFLFAACGGETPDAEANSGTPSSGATNRPDASQAGSMGTVADLASAPALHWTVVGDYAGDALILNVSTSGYAPVTDHVEMSFDISNDGNLTLVGEPTITNSATVMGALRNGGVGCRAPTMSGRYEHATIEQVKAGLGGMPAMVVRTDYPEGAVPVACTGGNQRSPARTSSTETELPLPGVAVLMMGDQLTGEEMRLTPDKRSIIVKKLGWTYTFTPSRGR